MRTECNKVLALSLCNTAFTKSVVVEEFEQTQGQVLAATVSYLKDTWSSALKSAVKTSLKEVPRPLCAHAFGGGSRRWRGLTPLAGARVPPAARLPRTPSPATHTSLAACAQVGKGWFNLEEKVGSVYAMSKLKRFLKSVNFMMQDSVIYLAEVRPMSYPLVTS